MKKIDNKGVTLVELIVVMAIGAIVALIAFSFLHDSTRFYNKVSAEVDIQMEAQTTYNQIRDLVMNAEIGVVAFGMPTSSEDRKLTVGGKDYRALVIYNKNNIQAIIYNPTNKKLYLVVDTRNIVKYGNQAHIVECVDKISDVNLMSEGVSKFNVDTSELNSVISNGMLQMKIEFTKKDKSNMYESYVTMRNKNVINPDRGY